MDDMDDIIKEFLIESHEGLDQVERDLVALEEDEAPELIARIFRAVHTLKGTCGFLGMGKLEGLAHIGENLLTKIRDGELHVTPDRATALLSMSDAVREILRCVEADGTEGDSDVSALQEELSRLLVADPAPASEPAAAGPAEAAPAETAEADAAEPAAEAPVAATPAPVELVSVKPAPVEPVASAKPASVKPAAPAKPAGAPDQARGVSLSDGVVRVGVDLLDELMNLVGELVLVRNQILQHAHSVEDATFVATSQRLNHVTTELQEGVMKTRMQPIGNVWSKFPRVVRDLARSCDKQIRIEMKGRHTELDRTIIEAIKDPLTHLVRNSVDHGIELPDAREAAGKAREGVLTLRAFHEGGQVNIVIADDGGGIGVERVRARALERGIITPAEAEQMSDREVMQIIFQPGFSTAVKVTNVSGRGVGMDVVKTNIERIGGTIDVQSQPGVGTSFKIKIPLTLAIIPALLVRSGGTRYAIPQVSLLELVRLEGKQLEQIQEIHGTPVLRLRGNLLPLVNLADALEVPQRPIDEAVNVVILQADDTHFGLIVEATHDTEEIVVKPLGKELKHIDAFAGATIMGDGRVALILDVLGLAQRSQLLVQETSLSDRRESGGNSEDTQTLLLVEGVDNRALAVPLAFVDRLEEIPPERVERAGPHEVVRYRGEILPLIHLSRLLFQAESRRTEEPLQVFVVSHEGRRVGLVVERLLDIVEAPLEIEELAPRVGVLGSAILHDRVVEVVDVAACVHAQTASRAIPSVVWAEAAE